MLVIVGVALQAVDEPCFLEFKNHVERIRAYFSKARIVFLISIEEIMRTPELLHCNADGYILRDNSRDAILSYLNLAMIGEKVLPAQLALLFTELTVEPVAEPLPGAYQLSVRESDIAQCLVLGESNKIIARHLQITESTVKVHLKNILRKLGVQNRTQAALRVINHEYEVAPSIRKTSLDQIA